MEKRAKDNPWKLKTPPLTSDYTMHVDTKDGREILVCTVGSTVLHYEQLPPSENWRELWINDEAVLCRDSFNGL